MLRKRYSTSRSSTTLVDDDVDDDTFLGAAARSPKPVSPYANTTAFPCESPSKSTFQQRYDSLEDQRTQLQNRKKDLEARTLESTQRSLSLLRDSEDVGIATAEELAMQREQLENTNIRLDEIKNNLDNSNKHIQGISSIFGSIKNYWSSRKSSDDKGKDGRTSSTNSSTRSASVDATPRSRRHLKNALERATTNTDVDEHPAMRIRGISTSQSRSSNDSQEFEDRLDRNLGEMASSLAKLKGLAEGLGNELTSQNNLLDTVINKAETADINIERQNKTINRLLRK